MLHDVNVNQGFNMLQSEIIRLSENYVKALARENADIVDGPYAGRFTAYGMYRGLGLPRNV